MISIKLECLLLYFLSSSSVHLCRLLLMIKPSNSLQNRNGAFNKSPISIDVICLDTALFKCPPKNRVYCLQYNGLAQKQSAYRSHERQYHHNYSLY